LLIFLFLILVLIYLYAQLGDEKVPELPIDNQDYIRVKLPRKSTRWQGEMAGEVKQDSVILQARLTKTGKVWLGDVAGEPGVGAFVISKSPDFQDAYRTRWMVATSENDYILKTKVSSLDPGTQYFFKLLSGPDVGELAYGPTGTFKTFSLEGVSEQIRFVAVTGMNRFAFRALALTKLNFRDLSLGFPALETILSHRPDFFISTGDTVYYDSPFFGRGKDLESMREKWHRQFAIPRFESLFLNVPTYWQKDDHDFRYEDSDPHGPNDPSPELGSYVFLEQVPVIDPLDGDPKTFRTYRVNDLLQIWLLETREYRDPNTDPPGPEKSMWGVEQKAWLHRTLLESNAVFKILISSVPMVGPDDEMKGVQGGILAPYFGGRPLGQEGDDRKRDNHTNKYGYLDEGNAFFDWLAENNFLEKNFYILCGDRHWQYHSVHPSGFQEFSVGALVDANSRLGPKPGDEQSTDPQSLVNQVYNQSEASGGFLEVTIYPPNGDTPAVVEFVFYNVLGDELYRVDFPASE